MLTTFDFDFVLNAQNWHHWTRLVINTVTECYWYVVKVWGAMLYGFGSKTPTAAAAYWTTATSPECSVALHCQTVSCKGTQLFMIWFCSRTAKTIAKNHSKQRAIQQP